MSTTKHRTARERLVSLLSEIVVEREDGPWRLKVDADDLWFNRSASRSWDDKAGVWGGSGMMVNPSGTELAVCFGSYDTMTACAKRGVTWLWRGSRPLDGGLDIIAREKSTTCTACDGRGFVSAR